MKESKKLKQFKLHTTEKKRLLPEFVPYPRCMGVFIFLLSLLTLTSGIIRSENGLTLIGAVLLAVFFYSMLSILFTALLHRKKARSLRCIIDPKQTLSGKDVTLSLSSDKPRTLFRLPGLLIRYKVRLYTKDGKNLVSLMYPSIDNRSAAPKIENALLVKQRGAYYSAYDELLIMDALGLLSVSFRIPQAQDARLSASPQPKDYYLSLKPIYGGAEQRREVNYQKTDDLIDHRPYVPGDDPRRINWKLFGHAGDLFVREGEPEPPPHSQLLILIDSHVDPELFTAEAARAAVDLLCEIALTLLIDFTEKNLSVKLGYTNGTIHEGSRAELSAVLAFPYAISLNEPAELPLSHKERSILLLALPRSAFSQSAGLDHCIAKRHAQQRVSIIFIYNTDSLAGAAANCASRYGRNQGLTAQSEFVSPL
ncbi:DUF58 domain-containing protein [Breznakiellaceae bacterium SP9]